MLVKKQPLVKLLTLIETLFVANPLPKSRGRPYSYSDLIMFKCLMVKTVKRFTDCSALYHYLSHEANSHIREAIGLADKMPCLKTFQRRFEDSADLMRRQLQAVAKELAELGVISFEMLAVDGSMIEALGPVWHQSDKAYAHIPEKLRNLDLTAEWGKSGYHGWVYGYKTMALCNCTPGQPYVFVDGWLLKANACETVSLRQELENRPLPASNQLLFGDSGFDDKSLFQLCHQQKSCLVTPVRASERSSDGRYLAEAMYLEYVNCGLYTQRSLSIEPLWAYLKSLFSLQEMHQHGLYKNESEVLAAMAAYNLIVYYNYQEGLKLRAVKTFLDVL